MAKKLTFTLPEHVRAKLVPERIVECSDCGDTGWQYSILPGGKTEDGYGSAGDLIRCRCQTPRGNERLLRRRLADAGLGSKEISSSFEAWNPEHEPDPQRWADEWLRWAVRKGQDPCPQSLTSKDRPGGPRSAWSLVLLGEPGIGKTMTAAKLARRYIEQGGSGLMWIWVRAAYEEVMAERLELGISITQKRIDSAPLVVLDEFGAVSAKRPEEEQDFWDVRLSARERFELPTVVTSNATGIDAFDSRVASRLAQGYYRVLHGEDGRDA